MTEERERYDAGEWMTVREDDIAQALQSMFLAMWPKRMLDFNVAMESAQTTKIEWLDWLTERSLSQPRPGELYAAMRNLAYAARGRDHYTQDLVNEHYRRLTSQEPPETLYKDLQASGQDDPHRTEHGPADYKRMLDNYTIADSWLAEYHEQMHGVESVELSVRMAELHAVMAQAEALRRIADALETND